VIPLKREINPAIGIVIVVVVVALSAYYLWHAQSDRPAYIGLNAPHPAAEMSGGKGGGSQDLSHVTPANANQMRIPGRSFNPDNPSATSGQAPATDKKSGQ
jgi:hypothetical protein